MNASTLYAIVQLYFLLRTVHQLLFQVMSANVSAAAAAASPSYQVVTLPTFELLPSSFLKAIENAASSLVTSTEEAGELLAMRAAKVAVADIPDGAFIVVPLRAPRENEAIDFTFLSSSPHAYIKLQGTPQTIMTYGSLAGFSDNFPETPVDIGTNVKFPSPSHLVVAKGDLLVALLKKVATVTSDTPGDNTAKRQCLRQLVEGGELAAAMEDKGMLKYILDLEGVRHATRVKTDIPQREKDLSFCFRAMDPERWEYAMGTDFTLQPEEYRRMLVEQSQTRSSSRNESFNSCGKLDRVHKLEFTVKSTKMELLLKGSVLVQGAEPTLSLEDFIEGEKILSDATICPNFNRALVATLRNVQVVLEIVFSPAFKGCLDAFIEQLEGEDRTMELVTSDFLRYSVENSLRQFFRVVRSEKAAVVRNESRVSNPVECCVFMKSLFMKLMSELADHQMRLVDEAYFRKRLASKCIEPQESSSLKKVRGSALSPAQKGVCAGHLGKYLKIDHTDGVRFKCDYGKDCRFLHPVLKSASKKDIRGLIDALPASVQPLFRRSK